MDEAYSGVFEVIGEVCIVCLYVSVLGWEIRIQSNLCISLCKESKYGQYYCSVSILEHKRAIRLTIMFDDEKRVLEMSGTYRTSFKSINLF